MTQKQAVLDHLLSGKELSSIEAMPINLVKLREAKSLPTN